MKVGVQRGRNGEQGKMNMFSVLFGFNQYDCQTLFRFVSSDRWCFALTNTHI